MSRNRPWRSCSLARSRRPGRRGLPSRGSTPVFPHSTSITRSGDRARPSGGRRCTRRRWMATPLAPRHVAGDRVGRRGATAFRERRQQRLHAHHQHAAAALVVRLRWRERLNCDHLVRSSARVRPGAAAISMLRSENSSLPTTVEQRVGVVRKPSLRGQVVEPASLVLALALQHLLDQPRDRLRHRLLAVASALNQARTFDFEREASSGNAEVGRSTSRATDRPRFTVGDLDRLAASAAASFSGTITPSTLARLGSDGRGRCAARRRSRWAWRPSGSSTTRGLRREDVDAVVERHRGRGRGRHSGPEPGRPTSTTKSRSHSSSCRSTALRACGHLHIERCRRRSRPHSPCTPASL